MQRLKRTLPLRLWWAGLLLMLLLAVPAIAQEQVGPGVGVPEQPAVVVTGMTLLVSLIAGVVLAIALQVLLTNLAIALGLNLMGPIAHHGPHETEGERQREKPRDTGDEAHERRKRHTGLFRSFRKLNCNLGVLAISTAVVALFLATWLGVGLSFIGTGAQISPAIGVVLGLVIWGVTVLIMARFEWSAMTSLAGGLYHMAGTGLRNVVNTAKSAFTASAADKVIEHGAERIEELAREVTEEVLGTRPGKTVDHKLREYLRMIRPEKKPVEKMRHELEEMLDEMEVHIVAQDHMPIADSGELVAHLVHKGHPPHRAKRLATRAKHALEIMAEERAKEVKSTPAKVIDATQRIAGKAEQEAKRDRERLERFFANTHREELEPEAIERELLDIFRHPSTGAHEFYDRLRAVNRDTIVAMLEQRNDISHDDAERIVNKAVNVIERIRERAASTLDHVIGAGERAEAEVEGAEARMKRYRDTLQEKLRDYLDRTGREELDFDEVKHDVKLLFSHPSEGISHWRERLKKLDRETLKGLIAARRDLDEQDAEMILNQIEAARDAAMMKLHEVEETVSKRLQAARDYAIEQADEARKTAANMAWWALGTGVASGVAAAIGGLVGAGFFVT